MIQDQLHTIEDPLAVKRQTLPLEVDLGPGKTETEALESTKNSLSDRISCRKRRDEQQTSSGRGAGTGTSRLDGILQLPDF